MGNLVKFGSYDLAEAEENERELSRGSGDFMKLGIGKNVVRILPPRPGQKVFVVAHQHYLEFPGVAKKAVFNCPRVMAKRRCRACDLADKYSRSGNPLDRTRAENFWPRKRIYCNAVNRAAPESGVQVLAIGKTVHEELIAIRKDMDIDFTHPETGHDIIILRKGTGKEGTKYKTLPAPKASPLGDLSIIDAQPDLSRFAAVPSDDQIDGKMSEASGGAEEDLSEEASAAPRPAKGATRTAADDAIDAEFEAELKEDDLKF